MATGTKRAKAAWPPPGCPAVLTEPPPPFDARVTAEERATRSADRWQSHRSALALQLAARMLDAAVDFFRPVRIYACFSGGYDSIVPVLCVMNRASVRGPWAMFRQDAPRYFKGVEARVLHINTGIGIEKTRQYVRDLCRDRYWPLDEIKSPESYEDLVLGRCPEVYRGGFPGPPMHAFMYQRLKERSIRIALKQAKEGHPRSACVLFVSGIRHDESMIRAGYQRAISKVDAQIWLNPFYWSQQSEFRDLRLWHWVPNNPVKDKLGMSGECLCGSYADKGELLRVRMACPETADYLEDLERRVRAAGFDWGYEDPGPPRDRAKKRKQVQDGVYVPWRSASLSSSV